MLQNPFRCLKKQDYIVWIISLITVGASNICARQVTAATLVGTLVGVTALIFVAKGNVWGQILSVIFCITYAITSYTFRYYGEMITYLFMSLPAAVMSIITWLRHPYEEGRSEVKIHRLNKAQILMMILLTVLATIAFYFILKALNTANLFFSTVSITTSFLASYLMFYRNSYYAVAYGVNDIVLIILWILATMENFSYFPMIICFVMFLVNDLYAFVNWKLREEKQHAIKTTACCKQTV